ncbi:2'-5' RNA ligase family protein [Caproiciproducens faecalis]|uniref:2'-5' RNA ligase n=1 Tax=Caproiciproducens faecalis TaxID=2820301 RepID=A0ABS7DR22_9FIRM|nr:2'-5' RNA ligase family protein [Caproiciproducens faecalis]MBW7573638.1 hypothetical protein [Caproiciproducens faecalis]
MELSNLYSEIQTRGITCIGDCREQRDNFLKHPASDTRMGISLLIRVPNEVAEQIVKVEHKLCKAEPGQYYYPTPDLHITVLDVLAAKPDYVYTSSLVDSYNNVLTKVLSSFPSFSIFLKGIIPSPNAILVKGYYQKTLAQIRQSIRKELHSERLPLDERYETISSHITISRFSDKLQNRTELLRVLSEYAEYDFGEFEVKRLQLAYHNWYDSKKTILAEYPLSGAVS